jgi:CRP-like cAMP-binding protein
LVAYTKKFAPGDVVFHEGEVADAVYFLESGQISITTALGDGDPVVLANLRPPQIFGELGVLDDHPRSATARAEVESEVRVVPLREFTTWIRQDPDNAREVMITLAGRLRDANAIITRQQAALREKN